MAHYYPLRRDDDEHSIDTPRLPIGGGFSVIDDDFDADDYGSDFQSSRFAGAPYGRCEGAE
ncbi:hypothetical protein [Sphingomonas sanguinis]|jgi:hypothetical protein|uniref:Uncharacterized protein n=1 Tax=Sphingomonas sanguinis TaxID=33051 RepID=A0A7Y7QTM0_9SPHN|nr:hypothetical protein [Sphingomonas sanguinis]MBZ6381128.1 hypothetical protein [Sphingomonas sanguinis]NNG51268.1 hypothetical protein [Sphingomonas sanguinis]NNG55218.1 hypothetical protein [Sphingomonas sanguinis]NVP30430.1 hypothetical protein [Sphingomonas sanguinis]